MQRDDADQRRPRTRRPPPRTPNASRSSRPRKAPSGHARARWRCDSPPIITAIARARAFTGTIAMATAAPTAQKPAQASALTTREANSTSYVGRQRARDLAQPEDGDERDQGRTARQPQRGDGEQRGADHHADREGGDEQSGLRDGDVHVVGDGRQQPGEHELAGAEGEDGEAEDVDGHRHAGRRLRERSRA